MTTELPQTDSQRIALLTLALDLFLLNHGARLAISRETLTFAESVRYEQRFQHKGGCEEACQSHPATD